MLLPIKGLADEVDQSSGEKTGTVSRPLFLSTIDAQIGQLYGIWGQWREDHFHAEEAAFICPPETLILPSEAASTAIIGSGLAHAERFPEQLQQLSTEYPDITPDAAVMAQRLSTGSLALALQPAHSLSPQYVQQNN